MPDGTVVAVKQLSAKSRQGNHEFITEIGMISASQHPNLVKLYGCCVEGNQLSLIYEYMENNSLSHALFGKLSIQVQNAKIHVKATGRYSFVFAEKLFHALFLYFNRKRLNS